MQKIIVGIDGRAFSAPLTGISRYIREVSMRLADELPLAHFIVYSQYPCTLPVQTNQWELRVDPAASARRLNSFVWFKARTFKLSSDDQLDVYWANTGFVPRLPAGVSVVASVYDLVYRVVPQTMRRLSLFQYRAFFARDIRKADEVIALSRGTAERLWQMAGIRATEIAPPGVSGCFTPPSPEDLAFNRRKYELRRPYFLAVGTLEPRKNFAVLVEAFNQWRTSEGYPECELLIVGRSGWRDAGLHELLRGSRSCVRLLGGASDADLPALYAGSTAFIFPSLYEGFGLPVLEARACGARIIASDIPEIREAGGKAATYVAPDVPSLVDALSHAWRRRAIERSSIASSLPSWSDASAVLATSLGRSRP
jgi:glycosyltransferase involved in cell wall biosynthesis